MHVVASWAQLKMLHVTPPLPLTSWQIERLSLCLGRLVNTGILPNACIGDDMRRKATSSVRAGALQSNGEGGTPTHLVEN